MSQKTIEFEAEKPNLEVYLSYSQASERRVRFAYQLEDACARNGIRLIFDADELVLGDSIGRFMDELSQARFVILALSEDYFRSPFCMREFVDVFEWEYMDQRVIPVIHERIDSTELQKILAKWHGDHAVLESLGCPDRNYAKLVSRINHGCETLVKPYLDQVNLAVDVQTPEFAELIKRLTKLAEREREHDLEELQRHIRTNVEKILDNQVFENLRAHCGNAVSPGMGSFDPKECAKRFVSLAPYDALDRLRTMAKNCAPRRGSELATIEEYWNGIKSVGCWLILGSVSPDWWIHNKFKLFRLKRKGVGVSLNLQEDAYAEVVLARRDFLKPRIDRDESGIMSRQDSPDFPRRAIELSIAQEDRFEAFLIALYSDIFRASPKTNDKKDMTKYLSARLTNLLSEKGHFCYLVNDEHYDRLRSTGLLDQIESTFSGLLHVIALNGSKKGIPATQDEILILDKLALIFECAEDAMGNVDDR